MTNYTSAVKLGLGSYGMHTLTFRRYFEEFMNVRTPNYLNFRNQSVEQVE